MKSAKPSVFISYAHKDGLEFTPRLAFALSMYMDVFWDRRLQAGDYPAQLLEEIEARDFILLVMSPYSLSSKWCLTECNHAVQHGKKVVLARIYNDSHSELEKELTAKYTYGPFTDDFEAGFRRVTSMMLGIPVSSWEYASSISDDNELLLMLEQGRIPALISRSLAQWILVEKLWKSIEQYRAFDNPLILFGVPRTSEGLMQQFNSLLEQFEFLNDAPAFVVITEAKKTLKPFMRKMKKADSEDHLATGQIVSKLGKDIYQYLLLLAQIKNSVNNFQQIESYFVFDVAEKLRELVFLHANRSRYLY